MSLLEQLKLVPPKDANGRKPGGHEKVCHKCRRMVHIELERCPSCGHAPWIWHQNARFLLITLVIAAFFLILMPLLTTTTKSYRTPVISSSTP